MKTNASLLLVAAAAGATFLASRYLSTALPGDITLAVFLSAAFGVKFLGDFARRPALRYLESTKPAPVLRPAAPAFIDASAPARFSVRRRPAATATKVAA